jgi:alkylated DNA nucleotide flippase Atl1
MKQIRAHPRSSVSKNFFSRVNTLVRKIPRGRVVTYGQIARALGAPGAAHGRLGDAYVR